MSLSAANYAVRPDAAPTQAALERRLREFASASHVPREDYEATFDDTVVLPTWRYFAGALARAGRPGPLAPLLALEPSGSPLVWAVRARHHVAGPYYVNAPEDVVRIDQRIRSVDAAEFERVFRAQYEATATEYEAGGLDPEGSRRSAGPDNFASEAVQWGELAAFYGRAAAGGRYVVSEIST